MRVLQIGGEGVGFQFLLQNHPQRYVLIYFTLSLRSGISNQSKSCEQMSVGSLKNVL